jgi:hypothetical protein
LYDLTYASYSFVAILNQTLYALGYELKYADDWPTLIAEGFQSKLSATKRGSPNSLPLTVVSRPYVRTYEARESVLLNILDFINEICGYKIGDIHFTEFMIRLTQLYNLM